MINLDEEKNRLTAELADHYARGGMNVDEYERVLEYIAKIETPKEAYIVEKIVREGTAVPAAAVPVPAGAGKRALFSWRSERLTPRGGAGGRFTSLFGAHRIVVDGLPEGTTALELRAFFGLIELVVPKHIRVTHAINPVFSGIFAPDETTAQDAGAPELRVTGKAVFGNITIIRV